MMKNYKVMKDGVVVNTIIIEHTEDYPLEEGYYLEEEIVETINTQVEDFVSFPIERL